MKQYFPFWIKYPFWWIFKSPQRKLGWKTLWRDLTGLMHVLSYYLGFRPRLKGVSICVGIKDRSDSFLGFFLPSLLACKNRELIELSIWDCGSIDVKKLEATLREKFPGKITFRSDPMPFQRAKAFNEAVRQAHQELVFLCDADFSLPTDLVEKCNAYTRNGAFWFPVVFYLYKNKTPRFGKKNGEWMLWGGKGLLAANRIDFIATGGLDERFTHWGQEDEAYWLNLHAQGKVIVRTREPGLLHHWHPSLNPKYKLLEELVDMGRL